MCLCSRQQDHQPAVLPVRIWGDHPHTEVILGPLPRLTVAEAHCRLGLMSVLGLSAPAPVSACTGVTASRCSASSLFPRGYGLHLEEATASIWKRLWPPPGGGYGLHPDNGDSWNPAGGCCWPRCGS